MLRVQRVPVLGTRGGAVRRRGRRFGVFAGRTRQNTTSVAEMRACLHHARASGLGVLHDLVTVGLGSLSGCWGHDGLVFDRGQPAESGLASSAVIGAFDPGNDRDA